MPSYLTGMFIVVMRRWCLMQHVNRNSRGTLKVCVYSVLKIATLGRIQFLFSRPAAEG